MKKRETLNVRLPRRLYKIIMDIRPLFMDFDEKDPTRGTITRALEYILQYYMESDDYAEKIKTKINLGKKWFEYLGEKEKETIRLILEGN